MELNLCKLLSVLGALGLIIWVVIMIELKIVYKNFGQGLKEKGM